MRRKDSEMLRVGSFTAAVDPLRRVKYFSFAIPDAGASAPDRASLGALREAFAARDRLPRVELFEELTPELAPVLEADGWQLYERLPVMVCTREGLASPPAPDDLVALRMEADAPDELIATYTSTQRRVFGDSTPVGPGDIARFRNRVRGGAVFVAGEIDGELVATAQCTPPTEGVVEVVGVATLEPYRGRGIAGALTAEVLAAAFAAGAELAWLTAADPGAERIYARAGFARIATQLAYDAVS